MFLTAKVLSYTSCRSTNVLSRQMFWGWLITCGDDDQALKWSSLLHHCAGLLDVGDDVVVVVMALAVGSRWKADVCWWASSRFFERGHRIILPKSRHTVALYLLQMSRWTEVMSPLTAASSVKHWWSATSALIAMLVTWSSIFLLLILTQLDI